MEVELKVHGLVIDPITQMPMLVLRDPATDDKLPIWVGAFEAYAITSELEHVRSPRPLTHDLLKNLLEEMGGTLERIVVTDVQDNIFYAVMKIKAADGVHELDCRPSDAIALALRCKAPIFVAPGVIGKAQEIDLTEGKQSSEEVRSWLEGLGREDLGQYEQ